MAKPRSERDARYNCSAKGKARHLRYNQSFKGSLRRERDNAKRIYAGGIYVGRI